MKHCGQPAAYVVADGTGLEWFVCSDHGNPPSGEDVKWIVRSTLEEWFRARAMPVPEDPRVCNEARLVVH